MTPAPALPSRRQGLAVALAAVFAALYFLWVLAGYAGLGTFLSHAEPHVTVHAWRLASGGALYAAPDSGDFLLTAYGPLVFLVNAAFLVLFGPSIAAAKLAGMTSAGLAVVVFADHARRAFGPASVGLAALLFLGLMLFGAPTTFWTRPDPHIILLVAVALHATNAGDGWRARLVIAVCAGLAVNLKAHAFVYFVPIVVGFCRARPGLVWPAMAVLAVAVFLAPFAHPQISLANYVGAVLDVAGGRPVEPGILAYSARYAVLFVSPGIILIAVRACAPRALEGRDVVYWAALFCAVGATLYPASVRGGFWYHLLPFIPLCADAVVRFAGALAPAPRLRAALLTLFAVCFAILGVTPQKRLLRTYESLAWGADAAAEVEAARRRFPGRTMEMGYGADVAETYKRTFVKPILAFAGNRVSIDGFSDMEAHYRGLALPPGKFAHMRDCATELWLIPAGETPFAMRGYYGGPAFWPAYTDAFLARYRRRAEGRFFDVWECRG